MVNSSHDVRLHRRAFARGSAGVPLQSCRWVNNTFLCFFGSTENGSIKIKVNISDPSTLMKVTI